MCVCFCVPITAHAFGCWKIVWMRVQPWCKITLGANCKSEGVIWTAGKTPGYSHYSPSQLIDAQGNTETQTIDRETKHTDHRKLNLTHLKALLSPYSTTHLSFSSFLQDQFCFQLFYKTRMESVSEIKTFTTDTPTSWVSFFTSYSSLKVIPHSWKCHGLSICEMSVRSRYS